MSMLSAQCDELRAMAESVGLAMPQAATLMMGAADAIDHLGGENAQLREMVRGVLVTKGSVQYEWLDASFAEVHGIGFTETARELGIEVDA